MSKKAEHYYCVFIRNELAINVFDFQAESAALARDHAEHHLDIRLERCDARILKIAKVPKA